MKVLRHARLNDVDSILNLTNHTGVGLTSLPNDRKTIETRIRRTINTLEGKSTKQDEGCFFVLEDTDSNEIIGVSAIEVAVGLTEPWYNYHVGTQVHASKELGVHKILKTLFLSNDLTGVSEICTLFINPERRNKNDGKLLSKARFMFIAAFQEKFHHKIIAEMRGLSDENGHSIFWDAVGKNFFDMDFAKADFLTGTGHKVFIAELMPRHPIYLDLLPENVKQVVGVVHPKTQPAYNMLLSEGFKYQGYVDIFDGGPCIETETQDLRAVRSSLITNITITENPTQTGIFYLIANDEYQNFRVFILDSVYINEHDQFVVEMTSDQAKILGLKPDQNVRILSLNANEGDHIVN